MLKASTYILLMAQMPDEVEIINDILVAPAIFIQGLALTPNNPQLEETILYLENAGASIKQIEENGDKLFRVSGSFRLSSENVNVFLKKLLGSKDYYKKVFSFIEHRLAEEKGLKIFKDQSEVDEHLLYTRKYLEIFQITPAINFEKQIVDNLEKDSKPQDFQMKNRFGVQGGQLSEILFPKQGNPGQINGKYETLNGSWSRTKDGKLIHFPKNNKVILNKADVNGELISNLETKKIELDNTETVLSDGILVEYLSNQPFREMQDRGTFVNCTQTINTLIRIKGDITIFKISEHQLGEVISPLDLLFHPTTIQIGISPNVNWINLPVTDPSLNFNYQPMASPSSSIGFGERLQNLLSATSNYISFGSNVLKESLVGATPNTNIQETEMQPLLRNEGPSIPATSSPPPVAFTHGYHQLRESLDSGLSDEDSAKTVDPISDGKKFQMH